MFYLETISYYLAKVSSHSSHEATQNPQGFFFFPSRNYVWKSHERDLPMCLNNIFNVGHKSVYLISFKSKVVCVPRLYLTGSLLVGMHSCGPHVNDEEKVCGSIGSGRSHRGVNGCKLSAYSFLVGNVSLTLQASQWF